MVVLTGEVEATPTGITKISTSPVWKHRTSNCSVDHLLQEWWSVRCTEVQPVNPREALMKRLFSTPNASEPCKVVHFRGLSKRQSVLS